KLSDIEHTAAPAYGIVNTIENLEEALKPTVNPKDNGNINAPTDLPNKGQLDVATNIKPVLAVVGDNSFDADDRAPLVFDHSSAIDIRNGTIAMSFTANQLFTYQTLFSKDASGYGNGHISASVNEVGSLVVRLQDTENSYYLEVDHAIDAGQEYDFALAFGRDGAELYLNGARVAYDADMKMGWNTNTEALIVGANGWSSTPGTTDSIHSHFNGTISDVAIYSRQLTGEQVFGDDARDDFAYFNRSIEDVGFARNSEGVVVTSPVARNIAVEQGVDFLQFNDMTVRVDTIQFGSGRDDDMRGRDGSDVLLGRGGDDDLRGYDNDDLLRGGAGEDDLFGGKGMDRLFGEDDDDRLFGGDTTDFLYGGDGHDALYGDGGSDRFFGGLGDDRIFGNTWDGKDNAANDRVYFDGEFADYSFSTQSWYDSTRASNLFQLTVTDSANGGSDGFYEGADRLIEVDFLVFEDRTVTFDSLLG
ncbi:MAG: LamG-like jellyroll fold domain-containing protein, partial [Sedimentitalea sp.]